MINREQLKTLGWTLFALLVLAAVLVVGSVYAGWFAGEVR